MFCSSSTSVFNTFKRKILRQLCLCVHSEFLANYKVWIVVGFFHSDFLNRVIGAKIDHFKLGNSLSNSHWSVCVSPLVYMQMCKQQNGNPGDNVHTYSHTLTHINTHPRTPIYHPHENTHKEQRLFLLWL